MALGLQKQTQTKGRGKKIAVAIFVLASAVLRFCAHTPNPHDSHALELLKANQYDQAIVELNAAIQQNPRDVQALTNRGHAYFQKHMFEQSAQDYGQAVAINPNLTMALNGVCISRAGMEDFDAAIQACTQAIKAKPDAGGLYAVRAATYSALNQPALALQDMNEAIKLMPDQGSFYSLRGYFNVNEGKFDDAQNDFAKAKQLGSSDFYFFLGQGMMKMTQGSYADAVEDFENANKQIADEAYGVIWLYLAKIHAGQDGKQEIQQLKQAITEHKWPSSVADLYAGLATLDDVRAQAATGYPALREEQGCEANYYIGEYYLQKNDKDNAKMALQAAMNSCPQNSSIERAACKIMRLEGSF